MSETGPRIVLEFGGGAELLFDGVKKREVRLPSNIHTLGELISWMAKELLADKDRDHLFIVGGALRAGILVLVNDQDWELVGREDYHLQEDDNVLFISTLHGG